MNKDKTDKNSQAAADAEKLNQLRDEITGTEESVASAKDLPDCWVSIRKWAKTNWLWILAHSINLLFAFLIPSSGSGLPILPGIIFTCIIFVQIYADPIDPIPTEQLNPNKRKQFEEKRAQQRYKWMIFAYSFMLLSLMLTLYPFIKPLHDTDAIKTLRDRPIAVFIGCSLDSTDKNLSCFKSKAADKEKNKPKSDGEEENKTDGKGKNQQDQQVAGAWAINIGGYINECVAKGEDSYGKATTCQVSDGLLVPLYFIILALIGGSISLTRRLPELQKQVSTEHIATERQPKLTQYEFREHLIFQIVQFISAPFLAILAYYLVEPSNTTNSVALAFTAGFASETILLMIRSIANKITPETSVAPKYGAIAGVITLPEKANGQPPEKVEVFLSESPQIHSITDERGFYMLGNVPVGEHSISIKSTSTGEILKKDTVKIERAQAIVKKNVTIVAQGSAQGRE